MIRSFTLLFLLAVLFSTTGAQSGGKIAYVRGSTEIRLIDPDGSNDRRLWTDKALTPELGVFGLAWKPDGTELAFSSAHEQLTSPYLADLYAIRPDGTGLRKITNPPDRAGLAKLPKGSVTVKVLNNTLDDKGPVTFIIHIEGSDEPVQVVLPPGVTKTIEFKSVADLGRRPQRITAMYGKYRWFYPALTSSRAGMWWLRSFRSWTKASSYSGRSARCGELTAPG